MIKNHKKGAREQLSTNFHSSEFDCNGTGCCNTTKIDENLVRYCQMIRDHFGKPVTIGSGYRCPIHNGNVPNAASKSKHTLGMAADIGVEGVAPAEVAKYAESIGVLGIGLYETDKDGYFVHIDTRTAKSFWYGHAQEYRSTFGGKPENKLTVDGEWGKDTTKASQKKLGTIADGIVSNQSARCKKFLPAALESSWEFKTEGYSDGSALVKAIQKLVGAEQDGLCGENTVTAMQKFLKNKGLYTDTVDGIMGVNTVKAWQTYING